MKTLEILLDLQDDWDGYGAPSVSRTAVLRCRKCLKGGGCDGEVGSIDYSLERGLRLAFFVFDVFAVEMATSSVYED